MLFCEKDGAPLKVTHTLPDDTAPLVTRRRTCAHGHVYVATELADPSVSWDSIAKTKGQ